MLVVFSFCHWEGPRNTTKLYHATDLTERCVCVWGGIQELPLSGDKGEREQSVKAWAL